MLKYWVWLSELKGLSNQTRLALLRHFSTPEEIFFADEAELNLTEGVDRQQIKLLANHDLTGADKILADCQRHNIRLVTFLDGEYPNRLRNIYDPPTLLYVKGNLPFFDDEVAVAVVGTRGCTPYGIACAEKFGYGLGKGGAIVVTGIAKGIDAAAARGALRAGGKVVAVLGNGIDVTYPYESKNLYEDVPAMGALISEYPPGTEPAGHHFPIRNRILSGLSLAALVVEAPARSGALSTANAALDQGKDLFAVPGPIGVKECEGSNRLIQQGAYLVMDAADILQTYEARFPTHLHVEKAHEVPETVGEPVKPAEEARLVAPTVHLHEVELTDDQIVLMQLMDEREPILVDELIDQSGIPTRRVLSALTVLEIDGYVKQHSGKRYTRTVSLAE